MSGTLGLARDATNWLTRLPHATRERWRLAPREVRETIVFRVTLWCKALDGLIESIGGLLLLIATPAEIRFVARLLTHGELSEDPNDFVATHLLAASRTLEHGQVSFWGSLYLLSHGLIKLVLVWAILRNHVWAYPWMIAFLGLFIVYQTYSMTHHFTLGLLLLTLFDLLVAWLTVREYVRIRRRRRSSRSVLQEADD
jgi:uncharacterized membrane protein